MSYRVVPIRLDRATFDILKPWVDAPIPHDLDGRVPGEIFAPEYQEPRPVE